MGILCGYLIATAIFRFELNLQLKDLNTGESRISIFFKFSFEILIAFYYFFLYFSVDLLFKFVRNSIAPGSELAIRRDRILCWVVTTPSNTVKTEAVKSTWGQRCDKLLFMSSQNGSNFFFSICWLRFLYFASFDVTDSSLPAIGLPLPGPESRDQLWNKAKLTLRYIYQNHLNDYDWFFKADDDT